MIFKDISLINEQNFPWYLLQVLDRAHFLPHIGSGEETRTQYQQLCQALDDYTRKTFYEWTQQVDKVRVVSLGSVYTSHSHWNILIYLYFCEPPFHFSPILSIFMIVVMIECKQFTNKYYRNLFNCKYCNTNCSVSFRTNCCESFSTYCSGLYCYVNLT